MKNAILWLGPITAILVGSLMKTAGADSPMCWTAAITILTAIWWIFEPIPIPATCFIPLALLPLVGVLQPSEVGEAYGHHLILLLLGGFMLSAGMERSGAHRRIALNMVHWLGGSGGRRLVFGFMAASAVLSMWISNTATTLMLLPIIMAVVEKVKEERLKIALLLGVAYAASVGGIGTPVGTPPNLVCIQIYREYFDIEPTFTQWMTWALPVVVVMIPLVGLWLTRGLKSNQRIELPAVGQWRSEEIRTLAVFAMTALLWVTRREPYGGWSGGLGLENANDASVALLGVVAMFVIPNGRGEKLLDWKTAAKIPWGILVLFGSGIAIAKAFKSSGLSDSLANQLTGLDQLPPLLLIGCVCLAVTFMTEVTSNTATTTLLMPILAAASIKADIDPRLIMIPAAMSASFAFMLPVATGPNAVIFGSEQLTVRTMAREGLALNLIGVVVITLLFFFTFR